MKITKYQLDLMKHTISDKNRNWFGTGLGTKNSDNFEDLVLKGYATKKGAPEWMGDDVIYFLTFKGKQIVEINNSKVLTTDERG